VILYNHLGQKLNKSHLEVAYSNNPHGYGFMWVEGGRLNTIKGLCDFDQIWSMAQELSGFAYSLHLRWRTTGVIADAQCHPFKILDKDADGIDFYVMHNGTIFDMPKHDKKSDTQIFSERFRAKILANDPSYRLSYIHKLENVIGKHNKMVFMTSDSRTMFVNKQAGKFIDGVWYSNTYSLQSGYRKKILAPVVSTVKVENNNKPAINIVTRPGKPAVAKFEKIKSEDLAEAMRIAILNRRVIRKPMKITTKQMKLH